MNKFISVFTKKYFKNYTGIPKICWLGIFSIFIDSIAGGVCFFLSLYFVNDLNFSVKTSGLLLSSYGLGTVVGGMLGGKLSDGISPNFATKSGLVLQSLTFLLLIKLTSAEALLLNLFIMGGAAYIFKTGINCWLLNRSGMNTELRLKTLNVARVASNLGLGMSGIIVGGLATSFSYIFFLSGLAFFVSVLILLWKDPGETVVTADGQKDKLVSFSMYGNNKLIIAILFFVFLIGLLIAQLGTTYPLYIQNSFKDLGVKAVSILFVLDTVVIVLFQAPLVNLLKRSNKIFFIGVGGLLMGLGMLILSFSTLFSIALVSCIIWSMGEMLFIPLSQLVCYEKQLEGKQGKSMGAYQATYALGTICGPMLGGMTYQYLGAKMIWYVSGIIGICCFLVCNYFKKYD